MTLTSSERIPLEQLFAVATGKRALTVGIPAAEGPARRFPLTPEGAAMLVARDIDVRIEKGAGAAIHYTDTRYLRAGACIVSRAEAFACDIVICLSPLNPEDARRLRRGALLLTVLDALMASPAVTLLLERQVVTVALDLIADGDGHAPFADILNEIDGRAAMAVSSALLADAEAGKGILLGGVAGIIPCEVTVIGAGIGGMSAARSAMGMGALVRMFDSDVYRLRRAAERLGSGVVTSSMHPRALVSALRTADVVVASQTNPPHAFDSDVVEGMKEGVITICLDGYGMPSATPMFPSMPVADLAAARRRIRHGDEADSPRVCYVNAAGTVPRTVAMALGNTLNGMFSDIVGCGGSTSNTLKINAGMRRAVCTFHGKPVNVVVARALGMRPVDINLLLQFS